MATERSIVPRNFVQTAQQGHFGHRWPLALRLSKPRHSAVRGTTKVHYFAGLVAASGQHRLAFEANTLIWAHSHPDSPAPNEVRPRQEEVEAFLRAALQRGWLVQRDGRSLQQEGARYRQRLDGWLSGERALNISDQSTHEVLRESWLKAPPMPGRDLAAQLPEVRKAIRANRPGRHRRPSEHPDLEVIQWQPASVAAGAAGAPGGGIGTDPAMEGNSQTNGNHSPAVPDDDDLLEALDDVEETPSWDDEDADRVEDLAEAAVRNLVAAGPPWLHDGVLSGDRHVGVYVGLVSGDEGPTVQGLAQPFHVFVEIYLRRDYPEAVLRPGWAMINGSFVLEVLDRDTGGRPRLVTVLSLRDRVEIVEPDTGRDGIRFEAVPAVVDYSSGTPRLRLV